MKKTIAVVFLLLLTSIFGSETGGLVAKEQPPGYFLPAQTYPVSASANQGQNPYLTHPEITNIMTTTVTTPANNTGDGYLFVTPSGTYYDGQSALMILENSGEPIYINIFAGEPFVGDFKVQTVNNIEYLSYHVSFIPGVNPLGTSYVMNDKYQVIDTWHYSGGAPNDMHDFQMLDNGHAILMAYVFVPFDFSPWGGPVNGTLVDVVLQEQDANKNVVFEWVARDHMPIGDTQFNLNTTNPVDYLHTNAVEVDDDGNWLLSHRHFSEITKISRQTGNIIWRMGGAGNEFTFTNDIGFSLQHDIRRLDNGNITIFDNGNFHDPQHSRALEYEIDEVNKTVTRVWGYPDDHSEFSVALANHQRLPNGNSFIGWGTQPKISEVEPDGTLAFEMLLGSAVYRGFRFPWIGTPAELPKGVLQYGADPTAVSIYTSWNGATSITGYDIYAGAILGNLSIVATTPRTGFETAITLNGLPADTCFYKTKPIHAQGNPTPFSNLMFRTDMPICLAQLEQSFMPLALD